MKILVSGAAGMLGRDLVEVFSAAGHTVTGAARDQLDIASAKACRQAVADHDVVINAAAWTAVDAAETSEPAAFDVNATGAANLARACRDHGRALVQISTDYVFDGVARSPYPETSLLAPRTAYGRTKAAGEWAAVANCPQVWIVRTAWLYGEHGKNFVKTIARLAGERDVLDVVDDQRGQPTWTFDVALAVRDLVEAGAPFGAYHASSQGETTWFELARSIFSELGLDPDRVRPMTTATLNLPAPRPAYSVLGHNAWDSAGLEPLPHWQDALHRSFRAVVGVKE